jgi:DNA-binding SARP family transcriptional activator
MTTEKIVSAKITRPSLTGTVQRHRLFPLLDRNGSRYITWVSAPGGSGKSTLVASYLDARNLPCLWYQCDEGDGDLATFFYYMGLAAKKAAPRIRRPLPLLTPQYLSGVPTFSRRFFEQLFARLPVNRPNLANHEFILVLDNYQEVPSASPFHETIAIGCDHIPEGVRLIIISRSAPPPALARLQADNKIDQLEFDVIRFSRDESKELVRGRHPELDDRYANALYEKSAGWAAGIILMTERSRLDSTGDEPEVGLASDRAFDYFAGELLNRTEVEVQEFLLKTAFLPVLSTPLAESLTGVGNAGEILSTLNRHHYFTERLSGSGQDYQYHPMFRDFLLSRAKTEFSTSQLRTVQLEAAQLLEKSGQIEYAAVLYCETGDHECLARMVIRYARELLTQGRSRVIEDWLECLSGKLGMDPWLYYWAGTCKFPVNMRLTRINLEQALALFMAREDAEGSYLSWAGIVDSHAFGDNWKSLDDCIDTFEELRRTYPDFPSKEVDLIASSRMLMSLTLRKTDQTQRVLGWLQRVSALLQENPSFDIQMDTAFCMSVYYLWKGEYDKNAVLLDRAEADSHHHKSSPFAVIRIKMMKGVHYWITAEYDDALRTLIEALEISEESGVHLYDSLLWSFKAAAEMAPGNFKMAEASLRQQRNSLLAIGSDLNTYFYHINAAWHATLTGSPSRAAEHLETISATVATMGTPYYRALWHIGMAQASYLLGRTREAKACIQTALRISLAMKSQVLEWYALLIEAWFLLQEGKTADGLLALHRGLSLGRRHGYVHLEFYLPAVKRALFAKALEEKIEPEYVTRVIRKLDLSPPLPPDCGAANCYMEEWPYPVKIYTLGRFVIIRDKEPLHFSGKEQKKPLDLLKALIAFGGSDVPEEQLTDALWPEADGDQAHKSLETTLSRLRRLLGGEEFIKYRARQLSINPLCCWVDSLALGQLVERIMTTSPDQAIPHCEKALALHKGPFLPADTALPWAVTSRETLKNRLLKIAITAGRHHEQGGDWERAAEYYYKGIETDNLAEEFYRRLMVCHGKLGNRADAVKTYNRCCSQLKSELGIEPSPETIAVYNALLQPQ